MCFLSQKAFISYACSQSGSGKSDGKVRVFRGKYPVSVQHSEAEDDQHTQVCGLEMKNISSTSVFILWGSAGVGSDFQNILSFSPSC